MNNGNNNSNNNNDSNAVSNNNQVKHVKRLKPSENELNKRHNKPNNNNNNNINFNATRGRNLSLMDGGSIASVSSLTDDQVSSMKSLSGLSILNDGNSSININDDSKFDFNNIETRNREQSVSVSVSLRTKQNEDEVLKNVTQKLASETNKIVYQGYMDRKTNQKVLGKRLWETRYFKLSTHSISIYVNENSEYPESVIKLSSVVSVTKSFKGVKNGKMKEGKRIEMVVSIGNSKLTDLTNKVSPKFNTELVDLRCPDFDQCNNWMKHLTLEKRKHRKSIRSGLESLALFQMKQEKINQQKIKYQQSIIDANNKLKQQQQEQQNNDDNNINITTTNDDNNDDDIKNNDINSEGNNDTTTNIIKAKMKKQQSKRFKRVKTKRGLDDDIMDENMNYSDPSISGGDNDTKQEQKTLKKSNNNNNINNENINNRHGRSLTIRSWAIDVTSKDTSTKFGVLNNIDTIGINDDIILSNKNNNNKPKLSEPISYSGNLFLKIGYNNENIGDKYFFKLYDDTLEYYNFDNDNDNDMMLIGGISMSHIKSIKKGNNNNEFILIFDDDSNNDWQLNTLNNDINKANKWFDVLTKAINEAKAVLQTIVNENKTPIPTNNNNNNNKKDNNKIHALNKRMMKRGKSQFKALADCIMEETIAELESIEMATTNNNNNLNEFDIKINNNNNSNNNIEQTNLPNNNTCSCLCFR